MNDSQLTPSQAARRYADEHGFKIVAVGRRYDIWFEPEGEPRNHVAQVGGFPAALNAMRKWVDDESTRQCTEPAPIEQKGMKGCAECTDEPECAWHQQCQRKAHCDVVRDDGAMGVFADAPVGVQTCAGGALVLPEPSADPALNATANNSFGTLEPITPDTVPMSREEMFAPIQAELDRLYGGAQTLAIDNPANWAHKTADEIKADIVAGVEMLTRQSRDLTDLEYGTGAALDAVAKRMGRDDLMRAAGMSDREYRNLLIYGDSRGMAGADYPMPKLAEFVPNVATGVFLDAKALRDYCEVDLADYLKTRERLFRKAQRRASGALAANSGPWHVMYNGQSVTHSGYASRADALTVVRWGFGHSDARVRNNWRTAAVTVEYRHV